MRNARTVTYCSKCLMPDTRPRVRFDENGVCNACLNAQQKNQTDWSARGKEFQEHILKRGGNDNPYDCVVPWSGGKDSTYIAHRLKFEFGLNPLLVTFSPLIPNDIAVHNREALIRMGFDHLMVRPNQRVSRQLSRRFLIERGHPKVHWDAGINSVPVQVATKYNIPLIIYAEHGESEYGGRVLSEESRKVRDFTEVVEHQIGDDPLNWMDVDIEEKDLAPYIYPESSEIESIGVKALYFSYFFRWSTFENYVYVKEHVDGFMTRPNGRTDGTFTDYDSLDDKIDNIYYYLQYIKFGFGRATRDASRMIQNGHMTRQEGLELAQKYDAEFPATFFEDCLEYLSLSEGEFNQIVDKHRNEELWKKSGTQWELRYPVR